MVSANEILYVGAQCKCTACLQVRCLNQMLMWHWKNLSMTPMSVGLCINGMSVKLDIQTFEEYEFAFL